MLHGLPVRTGLLGLLLGLATPAWAQAPALLTHHGILSHLGEPVTGDVAMVFSLYAQTGDATPFWSETLPAVPCVAGYYSVVLGLLTTLAPEDLAAATEPVLGIAVNGAAEMTPRIPITSVPYALAAVSALAAESAASLECVSCVTAEMVAFGYAASSSAGGPAQALECTDACVQTTEIANGAVVTAKLGDGAVTLAKLAACPPNQTLRSTGSGAWECSGVLSILDSGLVGINQSAPTAGLHVRGSMVTPLTGTVTGIAGNTTVLGAGTQFLIELVRGESFRVGSDTYTVATIDTNTQLTVTVAPAAGFTGATAFRGSEMFRIEDGAGAMRLAVDRFGAINFPDGSRQTSGSANFFPIRFTRGTIPSAESDANKDALCASEWGASYRGASLLEMNSYVQAEATYYNVSAPYFNTAGCSWASNGNCGTWGYYYFTYTNTTYGALSYLVQNSGNSTQRMACIRRDALLQFTRTAVVNSATDAAKDIQCVAEFGPNYRAASKLDLLAFLHTSPYYNSWTPRFNLAGLDASSYRFYHTYASGYGDGPYLVAEGAGTYTEVLACMAR